LGMGCWACSHQSQGKDQNTGEFTHWISPLNRVAGVRPKPFMLKGDQQRTRKCKGMAQPERNRKPWAVSQMRTASQMRASLIE